MLKESKRDSEIHEIHSLIKKLQKEQTIIREAPQENVDQFNIEVKQTHEEDFKGLIEMNTQVMR